jgi:hypothetical protein
MCGSAARSVDHLRCWVHSLISLSRCANKLIRSSRFEASPQSAWGGGLPWSPLLHSNQGQTSRRTLFQARRCINHHLPQMPRMPRTTTKAIHWTEPRITPTPFPLVSVKRKPPEFAVLSGPPVHRAAFLNLAQRAFCAAAIRARPASLIPWRFLEMTLNSAGLDLVALKLPDAAPGRPGLRFAWVRPDVSVNSAFACCSREISASIARTMSFVFMNPPSRA